MDVSIEIGDIDSQLYDNWEKKAALDIIVLIYVLMHLSKKEKL